MSDSDGSPPRALIFWLARCIRPYLSLAIGDLLCLIASSGLSLLDPLVVRWLIDFALPKRDFRLAAWGTLIFCAVYMANLAVNHLASFLSCVLTQKMVFRIRVSLIRQIQSSPPGRRDRSRVQDTLYRIEQDVDRVAELSGDILPLTIQMALAGVMVLVTMGILNWHLTVLVMPVLPIFYLVQRHYSVKLRNAADQVQAQAGKINTFLQELLAGMTQSLLLNRTNTQARKFALVAARGAQLQIQQRATETLFSGVSVSVVVLGVGLILGYGSYEVTRGALTVGGLVAFYGYVFRLFAPLSIAIDLQSRLQRIGTSIRRIEEVSHRQTGPDAPSNTLRLRSDIRPDLEFRSVCFAYHEGRPVLHDMSFRVEAGETVALVGLNGSGKSTIGMLATRLQDPNAGSILIGDCNIQGISPQSLRACITLIPQEPFFFDQTIRESLLYGDPSATDRELDAVAALTKLDLVLARFPKGLDEQLGPRGSRLSGGERKRLALARALLQKPRILIVDEVTSSLDAPAEFGVLEGLDVFRKQRTLIVVSHRPAAILWADRILVVANGAIADSGKHLELLERCAAYRKIWKSQHDVRSSRSSVAVNAIEPSQTTPQAAHYNF
jgi:ATP-binding cassette, subfamily B, bacterial